MANLFIAKINSFCIRQVIEVRTPAFIYFVCSHFLFSSPFYSDFLFFLPVYYLIYNY
jgi:hypothetical protein